MYALIFSVLAAGVFALGYSQHHTPAWVWWWLAGLFIVFVVIRYVAHQRSSAQLRAAFDELRHRYTVAYGNTSTGQRFLNGTKAWHEGLFLEGAKASLWTGDLEAVLVGGIVEYIGDLFTTGSKPPEQSVLERQIVGRAQVVASRKLEFTGSVTVTSIAYIAAAVAAYTALHVEPSLAEESRVTEFRRRFRAERKNVEPSLAKESRVPPIPFAVAPLPPTSTPAPPEPLVEAPSPVITIPPPKPPQPPPTPQPPTPEPLPKFATTAEAQRAAVQRYPDLGIAGSKLNTEFVARYKLYQQTRPDYFRDTSWPFRLAEELTQTPPSE